MLKTDARQANWRRANPGKHDAHLAVERALKAGELESRHVRSVGLRRSMLITMDITSL